MVQLSIFSWAELPANLSASQASEADLKTPVAPSLSNTSASCESSNPDGSFGRTSKEPSVQTKAGISMQSLQRLPTSGIVSDGEFLAAPNSVCLSREIDCSLLDVLEAASDISDRYYLSPKSILGHYRRIVRAGREKSIMPSIWTALCSYATTADKAQPNTSK